MIWAFIVGLGFDFLSHSYGLFASSLLVMAFFRRRLLNLFAPRDGYEVNKTLSCQSLVEHDLCVRDGLLREAQGSPRR